MAYQAYRGPTSPRDEQSYPNYPSNPLSPPRHQNRLSGGGMMSSATDQRGSLQRRFTTNALPTLSPIGQQRLQAAGEVKQQNTNRYSALPPSEQKSRFYESLLAEQRRIQAYIEQIDPETRREVDENLRHEHAVSQMIAQSEPTTPPDYGDAFPTSLSKPNRYSANSLTSAPNFSTRPNRSSTQLTSPPISHNRIYSANSNLPSQSVPGSRRHSDDEEEADDFAADYEMSIQKTVANPNRNSLPVTRHDRKQANVPDLSSVLGPVNTTSFLFGSEDQNSIAVKSIHTSPQDNKTYLQVQHTADGFPKLIRREDSAATNLLESEIAKAEQQIPAAGRNRISLPPTALRNNDANIAGLGGILSNTTDKSGNNRRSVEVRPQLKTTPPRSLANGSLSYSTNDVPTLKSINPLLSSPPSQINDITTTSHAKTPSLTRALSGSYNMVQQSNEYNSTPSNAETDLSSVFSQSSSLQASATPFGPSGTTTPQEQSLDNFNQTPFPQPAFYGGYGMQMLQQGFGNMNFNGPPQWGMSPYQQQANGYNQQQANGYNQQQANGYNGYQNGFHGNQNGHTSGGAARHDNHRNDHRNGRRQQRDDDLSLSRMNSVQSENIKGEVFNLCTDQHGCRFLQRKLDERDPSTTDTIFEEVRPNIIKLMIDPFGNYLCQKLLEYCSDEQRTELIKGTTAQMDEIALNQHGTRALQKMIEFIVTPEQTKLIIEALRYKVVLLIQDLNGNHVIQKCLNHLSAADAQFIFDAVGANCVTVGTHRHGCCVLQRCIDHAAGHQKGELIRQITMNAMTLIQDPFGNYVVQYILDIGEPAFTEPLCQAFLGHISQLSTQKFSSNVIEKCIRCSSKETKNMLIKEISMPSKLEGMLRDNYANYVVQTAIDFATADVKTLLVANIRPLLNGIRHTPYGRRIHSKINDYDGQLPVQNNTNETLNAGNNHSSPTAVLNSGGAYPNRNRMGFVGAPPAFSLTAQNGAPLNGNMVTPGLINAPNMINAMQNYNNIPMNSQRNQGYQFF